MSYNEKLDKILYNQEYIIDRVNNHFRMVKDLLRKILEKLDLFNITEKS